MINLINQIKTLNLDDLIKFIDLLTMKIDVVEKKGDIVCGEISFARQCLTSELKKRDLS